MLLRSVEHIFPVACQRIEEKGPDIVVSHAIELGAQWAARKYGIPYVTLSTTPWIWFSKDDPVIVDKRRLPAWMNAVVLHGLTGVSEFYFSVSIRKLRRRFQLPRGYGILKSFFGESVLNLGCWSALFRPETRDDPVNSFISGFTIERQRDPERMPKAMVDWLSQDSPPLMVGLGTTARWQGGHLYQAVAEACAALKKRCLLIGPELKEFEDLKSGIRTVPEIPFQEVFPSACVLAHHGGLGTTAQALLAGCPQLVVPFAHDQFYNAARVKRLGAGLSLPSKKISEKAVRNLIRQCLNDQQMNQRTKDLALQFQQEPYGPYFAAKAIFEGLGKEVRHKASAANPMNPTTMGLV